MKRLTALLLALVLCFALCACGEKGAGSPAGSDAQTGNDTPAGNATPEPITENRETVSGISEDTNLTIALPAEPDFLLPQGGNPTVADTIVIPCMYDTLFARDDSGEIAPCVAESYEWVDDTHIRITIRDDVIAADGTVITASDVLYTLEVGNTGNYAPYFQMYLNVGNCVVEDDANIVLELATPNPTFLYMISDVCFGIIDESSVEASGGVEANLMKPQCGTGRYTLSEWKSGQYITLARNDDYWGGSDDSYYKTITFTWVSDTASRALNVQSGDIDVAVDLSYSDVISMINTPEVSVFNAAAPRTVVVTFNCSEGGLFNNAKLREAVYYCVNAEDCAAVLFHGYSDTVETGVPTNVYYYYDQSDKVETSIEKAKACLTEAGVPNGFEFSLTVEPGAGYDIVAELMQSQLLEAGITMNINKVELIDYFGQVAGGSYEAYIGTLSCGDAITFLNQCDGRKDYLASHGGPAYWNDEMIEQVDLCYSTDEATSLAAFQRVQEIAFEDHIYVGICDFVNFTVTSSEITNYTTTPFGYVLAYMFRPTA